MKPHLGEFARVGAIVTVVTWQSRKQALDLNSTGSLAITSKSAA